KGKSDQKTLSRAKDRNAIKTKLRVKKPPQLNDRDTRMPTASRMRTKRTVRSNGFPSSIAWAISPTWLPSHCEGSRDPMMNIHVKGTQRANEVPESFAGSNHSRPKRRTTQRSSAKKGGIASILLWLAGYAWRHAMLAQN